jgi:transcriptional regulator with XRE-family HTH domain
MKCHRHVLILSKKYEIVSFWESNRHLSQRDIALRFGIPTTTLGDMLKNATKIKESFENAKRQRKTRFDEVNVALLAWFKETRMNNPEVAISGRVLLEKANNFGKQLAHSEDSISAAWIDRWKTRHNIVSKKMCGESAAVRESELLVHEWKAIKLRQILDTLSPRDIYNADETGLLWKALLIALWLLKMNEFQVVNCPKKE